MKHIVKNAEGNVRTMEVITTFPQQLLDNGWEDLGPTEIEGADTKYLKEESEGVVIVDQTAKDAAAAIIVSSERKRLGKLARTVCEDALDIIAGWNMERSLTAEQITTLQETFGTIEALLRAARPHTVKPLIVALEADGTLFTEEMKTEVLDALVAPEIGLN